MTTEYPRIQVTACMKVQKLFEANRIPRNPEEPNFSSREFAESFNALNGTHFTAAGSLFMLLKFIDSYDNDISDAGITIVEGCGVAQLRLKSCSFYVPAGMRNQGAIPKIGCNIVLPAYRTTDVNFEHPRPISMVCFLKANPEFGHKSFDDDMWHAYDRFSSSNAFPIKDEMMWMMGIKCSSPDKHDKLSQLYQTGLKYM